jgi:hypothetical protein
MHKRPVEPSMQPGRYKTITRPFSWPCRGKYEALGAAQNSNVIYGVIPPPPPPLMKLTSFV